MLNSVSTAFLAVVAIGIFPAGCTEQLPSVQGVFIVRNFAGK